MPSSSCQVAAIAENGTGRAPARPDRVGPFYHRAGAGRGARARAHAAAR